MRSILLVVISLPVLANAEAPKGSTPRDNAAANKPAPTGTWKGICDHGDSDWGDPMPITMTFRLAGEQLSLEAVIDFETEKKEPRRAKATLDGKRDDAKWRLAGKMVDVADQTEWEVALVTQLDGNKLSGKFYETDNHDALICSFAWTRK